MDLSVPSRNAASAAATRTLLLQIFFAFRVSLVMERRAGERPARRCCSARSFSSLWSYMGLRRSAIFKPWFAAASHPTTAAPPARRAQMLKTLVAGRHNPTTAMPQKLAVPHTIPATGRTSTARDIAWLLAARRGSSQISCAPAMRWGDFWPELRLQYLNILEI